MTIPELYEYYIKHPVVCTDTRAITPGCLFFALKGENFNGNLFAKQALDQGAAFAVIDDQTIAADKNYLLVDDVLLTLQQLAKYHRQKLAIPVIALTGSNGKTTTKELIYAVLSQKYDTHATKGNLNNHIGVPLTLLAIKTSTEIAIVEMGANHQQEIAMLCKIAEPNYGLITNIGKAHLEGFGGIEGVRKGKGEMYDHLENTQGTVFINTDNEELINLLKNKKLNEVRYGSKPDGIISGYLTGSDPFLKLIWINNQDQYQLKTNLTGIYNFENTLTAIAIGVYFNLTADEINTGITNYIPTNNRSQIVKTANNTVIQDFYNANPSSMLVAIDNIAKLSAEKKIIILGDMFELGEDSLSEHKHVIEHASSYAFADQIFIGEDFFKAKTSKTTGLFFKTTSDAKAYFLENPVKDNLVLLKGSRGMKLENLLEHL